jgi:hypothetical protein
LLFLLRDVEQSRQEIATLKEQLVETNQSVLKLAFEIQRISEHEQYEREKFMLEVENALLRFDKLCRPATKPKKRK